MMPTKLLLASTLALAVLAAGCMGDGDEATGDGEPTGDDAFNNDSIYGGDAGVTPDETGMGNGTNETNTTDVTNGTSG